MSRAGGSSRTWILAARRVAGALGLAALVATGDVQATIILRAEPGPDPASTIRLQLVSLHDIPDVLQLSATLTFAPLGALELLSVQYPASFAPALPPNLFPLPGASGSALARPAYLFAAAGQVDVAPGELFGWLLEIEPGAEGPFAFMVQLKAWPPAEDRLPAILSAQTSFATVPEPGTWVLLGAAGVSWLLLAGRRRAG